MNDSPERTPKFSDDQMDQLLEVFYQQEVPERLNQLPSSWPQLQADGPPAAAPRSSAAATPPSGQLSPQIEPVRPLHTSPARTIAMAATALAACLMVIVAASSFQSPETSDTVRHDDSPGVQESDLVNVSGSGQATGNGVVGADNTTLQEIDSIDLNPAATPTAEQRKQVRE